MTLDPDRAVLRIGRLMFALAAAGTIVLLAWRGWSWSTGWLLGFAAALFNFQWLRRITGALGAGEAKRRKAAVFGLRYLLLAAGAYVILKYTAISLPAVLAGLFVPVAAVILEILFELKYARN